MIARFWKKCSGAFDPRASWSEGASRLLVAGLLAIHVVWIAVHLALVADGKINPWKLGGYGMYTVPSPEARTHVYYFDEAENKWVEIPRKARKYNSFAFDLSNHLHVFRCRPPSEESLVGFLEENPHLRYQPLTLALSEQLFERKPISLRREIYAKVEIAWADKTRFAYRGEICGQAFQGDLAFKPSP